MCEEQISNQSWIRGFLAIAVSLIAAWGAMAQTADPVFPPDLRAMTADERANSERLTKQRDGYREKQNWIASELTSRELLILSESTWGPAHPETVAPISELVRDMANQDKPQTPFLRRILEIYVARLGAASPQADRAANTLMVINLGESGFAETVKDIERYLDALRMDPEASPFMVATWQAELGAVMIDNGRISEGALLAQNALADLEKKVGKDSTDLLEALEFAGLTMMFTRQWDEAEKTFSRAVAIAERVNNRPTASPIVSPLIRLGQLQAYQKNSVQAEQTFRRVLQLVPCEDWSHPEDAEKSDVYFGYMLLMNGKHAEAVSAFENGLECRREQLPPDHFEIADSHSRLVTAYIFQDRPLQGLSEAVRGLQVLGIVKLDIRSDVETSEVEFSINAESLSDEEATVATDLLTDMADLMLTLGAVSPGDTGAFGIIAQLEMLNTAALQYAQQVNDQSATFRAQRGLALALSMQGRLDDLAQAIPIPSTEDEAIDPIAGSLVAVALSTTGRTEDARIMLGAVRSRLDTASSGSDMLPSINLADAWVSLFDSRPWSALTAARAAVAALQVSLSVSDQTEPDEMMLVGFAGFGLLHSQAIFGWTENGVAVDVDKLFVESFEVVQLTAGISTSSAFRAGNARLVAARQDASSEWSALVKAQTSVKQAEVASAVSNLFGERLSQFSPDDDLANAADYAEAKLKLTNAETALRALAPAYFDLLIPRSVPLTELQSSDQGRGLLREDEALIVIVPGLNLKEAPEPLQRGLVYVVTDRQTAWARIDMTSSELKASIEALRASLESYGGTQQQISQPETATRAPGLVSMSPFRNATFPAGTAVRLNQALFGAPKVQQLLSSKQSWIIAPQGEGELMSLPYAALIVDAPEDLSESVTGAAALRSIEWLGLRKSLSVIPSVSALRAQRGAGRVIASAEERLPFLGIGGALFGQGRPASVSAARAPSQEEDPDIILALARLADLPQTRTEIRQLADLLEAGAGSVLLDEQANEAELRRRDASGELDRIDVIAIATHGLVAGELDARIDEPALALTPPRAQPGRAVDPSDDGLLLASEIANLRLSARWVILSACNTAAGNSGSTPALSGLAASFMFAGAQSLLVSHWPVQDEAAARLTTQAVRYQQNGETAPDALRLSMLDVFTDRSRDDKPVSNAHPSVWAPFLLVSGE